MWGWGYGPTWVICFLQVSSPITNRAIREDLVSDIFKEIKLHQDEGKWYDYLQMGAW